MNSFDFEIARFETFSRNSLRKGNQVVKIVADPLQHESYFVPNFRDLYWSFVDSQKPVLMILA